MRRRRAFGAFPGGRAGNLRLAWLGVLFIFALGLGFLCAAWFSGRFPREENFPQQGLPLEKPVRVSPVPFAFVSGDEKNAVSLTSPVPTPQAQTEGFLTSEPEDSRYAPVVEDMPDGVLVVPGKKPMVGIVVDDFGYNGSIAREFAELEIPLTWSIIPGASGTEKARKIADEKDIPYMIHLPMQAVTDVKGSRLYRESWIVEGMTPEEIRSAVLRALEELPGAVALNNHRGSLSTASVELMEPLMDVLREKEIPFVDSRTIGNSVAFATARARGLPALYNSVFLDHQVDDKFMRKQMSKAVAIAEKRGWVVVICHIRPHTLAYLKSLAPEKFETVEFVTIPKLFGAVKTRGKAGAVE